MSQHSLFDTATDIGAVLKERGITLALRNANEVTPGWGERARIWMTKFVNESPNNYQFLGEDFREWVKDKLEEPPNKRAFGAIILWAAKHKMIRKIGHATVKNPNAHKCFSSLWIIEK